MATREIGLMKLVDPEFISLVTSPANQTGFKIIRSTQENNDMAHNDRNLRVRTTKQKRTDGLLFIDFPAGITTEDAEELMDSFGLGDDYELSVNDLGEYYAKRTGDEYLNVPTTPIDLGNGFIANIATESLASRSDKAITGVALVGLEFDETFNDVESVKRWMEERDINFKTNGVEVLDGGTFVTRHSTPEDTEVRKVRLGDGVTGLVSKTREDDVPAKVYRSVVEQSYGNWGWGHLDFATALADPAFSDASWDAIYILRDVLENVIIYSGLPLDDRKTLVQNVCDQFTQYMTSLIDSLPRGVIEQARADRKHKQEPNTMASTDRDNNKGVARKDKASAKSKDAATEEDVSRDDEPKDTEDKQADGKSNEPVTRSELEEVVGAAVVAAMATAKQTPEGTSTSRSDEGTADDSSSEGEAGDTDTLAALKTMGTAMAAMGESVAAITRSVEQVKGDIEELNGTTAIRSDEDDANAVEEDDDTNAVKTKRDDNASPFDGMFGNRFN